MMKQLSSLVVLLGFWVAVAVCSSMSWTDCASAGGTCDVKGSGQRTVRMGNGAGWSFMSATNGGLPCNAETFGDAAPGQNKKCWYADHELSIPNKDWRYCAQGDANYNCKWNLGNRPFSIRYGDNQSNVYIYAQAVQEFPCSSGAFGVDPDVGVQKSCWVATEPSQWTSAKTKWVSCAEEGENCHLPISDAVYQVKMTADGYTDGQVKSFSASSVACNVWDISKNSASFQDWFYGSKKQCWYSQKPTSEFSQNTGFWKQVETCPPGASCSFGVQFGTSSTSSSSHTSEWSDSLSDSMEENLVFEKNTLTSTVSSSVSNTQSDAYGVSVTEACQVNCKTSSNSAVYVYQWQATSQEINYQATGGGTSLTRPFTTFACYWACQNKAIAPACPPNYCDYSKDINCQKCTTNIYGSSAPEPEEELPKPYAYKKQWISPPRRV